MPNPTTATHTILTADGEYFDYLNPDPAMMTLHSIATGLSNTCRFAGQCSEFYSVAEHSVYVSMLVPVEHARAGLLHDAPEAFICDMPKPLKVLLPDYCAVEDRIERILLGKIGVDELDPSIKRADRIMLRTEQVQLMKNNHAWKWTAGEEAADITIKKLQPREAYWFFMDRAAELGL